MNHTVKTSCNKIEINKKKLLTAHLVLSMFGFTGWVVYLQQKALKGGVIVFFVQKKDFLL